MARLRAECDWKSMQTHRSLARYLLEETYETLEAIDTGDLAHLREELGDLLLQVYFHAEIAAQHGDFDIDDVAGDLIAKLVRRNPHVFGDARVSGAASVNELWESVKATEKRAIPSSTASRRPFPPCSTPTRSSTACPDGGVVSTGSTTEHGSTTELWLDHRTDSSTTEPPEIELIETASDDLGDRLLALVAECREAGVDPEQALREAVRRIL